MRDAKEIMKLNAQMESERSNFESMWQESANLLLPRQSDFLGEWRSQGQDRNIDIYDDYGVLALGDAVSVSRGYVMPRGSLFQHIVAQEPELMKLQHVAAWFERKTQRLFELRNDPRSGFVQETDESWASLIAFGNQAMVVDLRYDLVTRQPIGLRYRSEHIGRICIQEDFQGLPGIIHRKFRWRASQALGYWGPQKLARAPKVLEAATDRQKENNQFDFIQVIEPNTQLVPGRLDWQGKPYIGGYVSCADNAWIEPGGWRSQRIVYSRFAKSPNEEYGRGPGIDALPSLKEIQQVKLDLMVGAEMSLMPPLGAHDDMQDQVIHYAAGEISYGAIDARGNRMVQKLFEAGDMQPALMLQAALYQNVDRLFFRDLLQIRQDLKSHVTDSQLFDRRSERGMLLAPLGRQETEWFSPMLDVEIDCMAEMGEFNDMPGEVIEAGGAKQAIYDNPLNREQRAQQAGGYFRMLEKVGAMAQFRPEAVDEFFLEYPLAKVLPKLAEIDGVPASWAATSEEKAERKAEMDAQAQTQQLLAALPAVGKAAKDLSAAGAGNVLQG